MGANTKIPVTGSSVNRNALLIREILEKNGQTSLR